MNLAHPVPEMAIPALRRVERALLTACSCGGETCSLVRREIEPEGRPRYWTVWLQCQTCGRGTDGPLSLAEHFGWKTYTEWNPALRDAWEADRLSRFVAQADKARIAAVDARRQRSDEYSGFCRTDPRWHALVKRVLWRSRGHCEACLDAPAEVVHHLTYAFGLLPPAWELRAVCRACHDRLHADIHGTEDEWAPRTVSSGTPADAEV